MTIMRLFREDEESRRIWGAGPNLGWYRYWKERANKPREFWVKVVQVEAVICPVIVASAHWYVHKDGVWRNLQDIVVNAAGRGQGIGRMLIEHIGAPIKLKTDVESKANGFYKHLGFQEQETVISRNGEKVLRVWHLYKTEEEQ
jgi:GNAT superfamily N-acetyltransferase